MHKPRAELQYLAIAEQILEEGEPTDDRTGVGTLDYFGKAQMCIDLSEGFPLLTSKFVATKSIIGELAWMLQGKTDLGYLTERNIHIWDEWPFKAYLKRTNQDVPAQGSDEWNAKKAEYLSSIMSDETIENGETFADEYGDLGPIYGHQWRAWEGNDGKSIDQLRIAQKLIRDDKASRRIIVSAWNVGDLEAMEVAGLPPCHMLYQFNASDMIDPETGKKYLDMVMTQRSGDWFLGIPFNMAQYALILSAMAQTTHRTPRYFSHVINSAHIYNNHIDQVKEQLSRKDDLYDMPKLEMNPNVTDIGDFTPEDFRIVGYKHHAAIKAQVAI